MLPSHARSFISSSTAIAATLQLAILHEQDLMSSASGFIAGDPNASNQQFVQWATSVDALARYPELIGFGYSVIVTAAELPAFALQAGPILPAVGREWQPFAGRATRQAFVLLLRAGRVSSMTTVHCRPARTCVRPVPSGPHRCLSRDSGQERLHADTARTDTYLVLQAPVYQGGVVPADRRRDGAPRSSAGWEWSVSAPGSYCNRGVARPPRHHRDIPLPRRVFERDVPKWQASDRRRVGDDQLAQRLDGHDLRCCRFRRDARKWRRAVLLLIAGIALSLLVGTLMFVLGTGRARALRVVQRTDRRVAPSGVARRVDRAAEPGLDHGPHRAAPGPQPAQGTERRGLVRRSRRVQERERHPGPRRGRPAARGGRGPPAEHPSRRGHDRPDGRRRVRRADRRGVARTLPRSWSPNACWKSCANRSCSTVRRCP